MLTPEQEALAEELAKDDLDTAMSSWMDYAGAYSPQRPALEDFLPEARAFIQRVLDTVEVVYSE